MKYFALVVFLFSTIILNAQTAIEEISYIPSRSGYYNNLVVKGDANIKKIESKAVDIISYGSILNFKTPADKIIIKDLKVSTGTAVIYSSFNLGGSSSGSNQTSSKGSMMTVSTPYLFEPAGGNLSFSKASFSDNISLDIHLFSFPEIDDDEPRNINVRTKNIDLSNLEENTQPPDINSYVHVKELYIFGMKYPTCGKKYGWQNVTLADNSIVTILVCNPSTN